MEAGRQADYDAVDRRVIQRGAPVRERPRPWSHSLRLAAERRVRLGEREDPCLGQTGKNGKVMDARDPATTEDGDPDHG